jgi:hypothetical protein
MEAESEGRASNRGCDIRLTSRACSSEWNSCLEEEYMLSQVYVQYKANGHCSVESKNLEAI